MTKPTIRKVHTSLQRQMARPGGRLIVEAESRANQALEGVARNWVGFETLYLYCGERLVTVLSNPALGFAAPLPDLDLADIRFATAA